MKVPWLRGRRPRLQDTLDKACREATGHFEDELFKRALLWDKMLGGTGLPRKVPIWERLTWRFRGPMVYDESEEGDEDEE